MRFHGILITCDEEDIIGQCMASALTWCDSLYVFDTGSADQGWPIVQDFVRKDTRVKAFRQESGRVLMSEGLRGYVFERFRDRMEAGDWIVQVDSDEFYHVPPPEFVGRLRRHETGVYNCTYEFRLTHQEAEAWNSGRETVRDRQRPIEDRRRYFNILAYSEPRMFRYRRNMQWPPHVAYPYNMGFIACERIPIRHYPQRDPLQLQKRWQLRSFVTPLMDEKWKHWQLSDWRLLLADDAAADLHYWAAGTPLPEAPGSKPLSSVPKRLVQRLVHSALLPVVDRMRRAFPRSSSRRWCRRISCNG